VSAEGFLKYDLMTAHVLSSNAAVSGVHGTKLGMCSSGTAGGSETLFTSKGVLVSMLLLPTKHSILVLMRLICGDPAK
jgi:hypothetical protein